MSIKKPNFDFIHGDNNISITGSFVAEVPYGNNQEKLNLEEKGLLLLPVFNGVVFPDIPGPVRLNPGIMTDTANKGFENGQYLFAVNVRPGVSKPSNITDFYPIGVVIKIVKIVNLPGNETIAFISGFNRAKLLNVNASEGFLNADIKILKKIAEPKNISPENQLLLKTIDSAYQESLKFLPEQEKNHIQINLDGLSHNIVGRIFSMALNSPLSNEEKISLLECVSFKNLLESFMKLLDLSLQKLELLGSIHSRTHEDLTNQQKEMFLKQQIKAIQEELGEDFNDSDENRLKQMAKEKKWSHETRNYFEKEIQKLNRLNPQSPDYSIQYTYLETFLNLPWQNYSDEKFSLSKVEKILNRDHFGLENVKDRIIEQMAVIKLRNDLKAPILCLYGPPGVGKTSLGKSVADALGRDYMRISLGGVNDEAEIRGHRKTYIGAMPGRILAAIAKCETGNPVIVLDEIDKIGRDYKGDPSTALLEVLDPEQNSAFHDNYIDYDYDLSKVLFIATANDISTISRPLLDRMELIEVGGYITEEKIEIASKYLVPKALKENGFKEKEILFSKPSLNYLIEHYTRESGVRQLEKKIGKVLRKIARLKVSGKDFSKLITPEYIKTLLGKEEVTLDAYDNNNYAGVVTGLAWTQVGGEILFIESSLTKGKGDKLTLTGNLGDVMKESATIALQYMKANAEEFGIDPELFSKYDIHIHVPEGAIPKDGPSAGITMATSIASAFTGKKVKEKIAMTGEITLRGKVLPVGGIREKILAAKRAGIKEIILSEKNKKDIDEIPEKYLKGLEFHFVESVNDVLNLALIDELAEHRFHLN